MEPMLSGSTGAASTGPNGGLKSWWTLIVTEHHHFSHENWHSSGYIMGPSASKLAKDRFTECVISTQDMFD